MHRKIGVLTGGGDCPGLNAAIRAVTKSAIQGGYEVLGIRNGWKGFWDNDTVVLNRINTSGIIDRGGTILFFAPTEPDVNLSIPVNEFWRNSITLMTSYGSSPGDTEESIKILRTGKLPVNKLITHRLPLEETGKGFKLVAESKESIKVIIEPNK